MIYLSNECNGFVRHFLIRIFSDKTFELITCFFFVVAVVGANVVDVIDVAVVCNEPCNVMHV